jgi:sugar/nucleoside kinase (ribokinase family)
MDTDGGRVSIFVTQSSEQINYNTNAIEAALQQADIIVLNIIAYCRGLIPLVKKHNKPVWTDLHDYDGSNPYHQDFINASQYIHLSSDNLPNYKTTMQQLIDAGKKLVICTHGKQGATLLTKQGEWLEQAALTNMTIADSNGAGDSFFAGFLFGFIQNKPLQTCLQYGAICGAYCVSDKELVYKKLTAQMLEKF